MYWRTLVLLSIVSLSWGEDYYEQLGVKRDADHREIRKAFKKLAVTSHPDKNQDDPGAHAKFVKLTQAYEVLKDPELRKKYDLYGEEGVSGGYKPQKYHSWNYYQNNFGIYDDDPRVVTLNKNDYDENVLQSENIWFINFYSAQCSHCHHLAPVWRQVAKDLEGVLRIGAVNCEDDWQLCHQIGVKSYPTLIHYPRQSEYGVRYTGDRTHEAIMRFVLDKLDANVKEISGSVWNMLRKGESETERPTLVFICGPNRNCYTSDDRKKIAAIFDKMINVRVFSCRDNECDTVSYETGVVYVPGRSADSWGPVFLDNVQDLQELVKKVLEQLPEPQDLSETDFLEIKKRLELGSDLGWLICFYMGHATELDIQLKRLPASVDGINFGKVHCGRYAKLCKSLNVNRYPMWGVLKPSGTFELNHGKDTMNHIASFAKNSIKASNVHALSSEEILAIMKNNADNEAWFVDWYAPWCPPCLRFLPELRKASLQFVPSQVRFGTVDCTIHSTICQTYNIRSYPTAMLVNNTNTNLLLGDKTATNVVEFINEIINPTVISLTSDNFQKKVGKKKADEIWYIDYYAPWCGPCQQLTPQWRIVAQTLKILPRVMVGSVNCEVEKTLCASQGVRSYPTIRLYPLGSEGLNTVALYNGQRDALSLLRWLEEFLPVKVRQLDSTSFEKEVLPREEIWLVDFFTPWCGHCQRLEPHYFAAAQLLEGRVKFAKVNCDHYRPLCLRAAVKAYPTMMLYHSQQLKKNTYQGDEVNGASSARSILDDIEELLKSTSQIDHDEL